MITVRPATVEDGNYLLALRNDPDTQANSRSTAPVAQEEHDRWMKFNVLQGYPQHLVLIAADDERGPIGSVRFDGSRADVMRFEVSITIAPRYRGQGLGAATLREACSYMTEYTLDAEIRNANAASRKMFESCGFQEIGRSGGYLQFRKEAER